MISWKGRQFFVDVHDRIAAAGVVLYEDGDGTQCSDPLMAQLIIDSYTLDDAKRFKKSMIAAKAKELHDKAIRDYSPGEMASWPVKLNQAMKYQETKNPADAPFLNAEAQRRSISLDEIANKVLSNAVAFSTLEALISGADGFHRDQVSGLYSFEDVAAYDHLNGWPDV